jgi:cytochrome c-type biogenesis protein CcmH
MTRFFLVLALALLVALPPAADAALRPDELLEDPELEARARALGRELRCVVCQNQSIDDSNAELAQDFRRIVRERVLAGETDDEILRFMVDRYGEFVLLKPPVTAGTIILWGGPFAVLLLGAGIAVMTARRKRDGSEAAELTVEERRRLGELLDDGAGAVEGRK